VPAYFDFDITAGTPTHREGRVFWDNVDHTFGVMPDISGVVHQVGQESYVRIVNKTGSTLLNGSAVYIQTAIGNRPTAALADKGSPVTSHVIGVITSDVLDQDEGFATTFGLVRGVNTSTFSAGDPLFLGSAGGLQITPPTGTDYVWFVGVALNSTVNGSIFVSPMVPTGISNQGDVLDGTPTSGNLLSGNGTRWTTTAPSAIRKWSVQAIGDANHTVAAGVDEYVSMGTRTAARTVTLPASPTTGQTVPVKDSSGQATLYPITIDGNGNTIDGSATISLSLDRASVTLIHNGTSWDIT
jgi:hypothetical protein